MLGRHSYTRCDRTCRNGDRHRDGSWLLSAGLLLAACFAAGGSQATILTFDQSRNATGTTVVPTAAGSAVQADYGDNVTGSPMDVSGGQFTYGNGGEGYTPNVVADFFAATDVSLWTIQYGDLSNVLLARAPLSGAVAGSLNVRLTADPGFRVALYHFDLAGWANTDYTINAVNILGDGGLLFNRSGVLVEGDFSGPRHTAFDFSVPLSATELLIEIDFSNIAAAMQDNIGMDNIRFGQQPPQIVPLPAAGVLFSAGLALLVACSAGRPGRPVGCA